LISIERHIAPGETVGPEKFSERLLERAHSLTTFPYRHGSWAKHPNIRKVPLDAYLIFYKIHDEEQVVEILRFWHAARGQGRLRLREETAPAYVVSPSSIPVPA